jgi:RNA polymerase sigma-70 factor (ECF subfamily)
MWSAILAVGDADAPASLQALERLARAYWQPLYIFLRQRGADPDAAADQVQGFFAHLLSREFLRELRPGDGRFRNFLLVALRRWVRDQAERDQAAKRGGGIAPLPLDELEALRAEPLARDGDSPDVAFERAWARGVFSRALSQVASAWAGRSELFAALRLSLEGSPDAENYRDIALRLGTTEGAVGKAAHDLRQQFAARVRMEIRATVPDESEVDDELRHLVRLLRN